MNKHLMLMRDVVCKYHPDFRNSQDLRQFGMTKPTLFNIERLVEESLAAVGGYEFVDEEGRDFNDKWNSDSKTVTVIQYPSKMVAEIGSVENKIGSLRVTIYNPFNEGTDFMYIPKRDLSYLKLPCYGKNSHKERLKITWNSQADHYNKFEEFRVRSFEELAHKGG